MAIAAKLTAVLNLDSATFEKNLSKSKKNFSSFSDNLKRGAKAGAVALAAVTAALGALGARQANVIDETAKLTKALGVNIKEFQALALVADESGISQDNLGNIITRSQRSIIEATRGLETYSRSFRTLNLDVAKLAKQSPEEQFLTIAKALSEVESPTLRTATALEIFGRSGRQVINALDGLVNNLDDAREFNDKFNISLTKIDATKVEEANDTFARLGKAVGGLGNTIAVKLAPIVTALSNSLLRAGVDGVSFSKSLDSALSVVTGTVDTLRKTVLGISGAFIQVQLQAEKAAAFTQQFFQPKSAEAARQRIKVLQDAYASLVEEVQGFETTRSRLNVIEEEANRRAEEALSRTQDLSKAYAEIDAQQKEATKTNNEYFSSISSSFEEAVFSANSFRDVLKGVALDIAKIAFRKNVTNPFVDAATGFLGGLFSGGGSGGVPAPEPKPSFATGIKNVPYDMTARLHKGESVITAQQTRSMSSGGGAVYNIDARGADAGVEQRIRNVMMEVEQLRKNVPQIAVSSVKDANNRNLGLLR